MNFFRDTFRVDNFLQKTVSARLLVSLFFLLSVLLLPIFRYRFNPDAIGYLRIASYYQQAEFHTAINGYWSPLISWLLIPFYVLGLHWLIAFRLLNILIASACLLKLHTLLNDFFLNLPAFAKNCLLTSFSFLLLTLHFIAITPDLLVLCLLLYLLYSFLANTLLKNPARTAILGVLLFLAKAYCFYFFLGFIVTLFFYKWLTKKLSSKKIKAFLAIIITFFLLSAIWIGLLYQKYGILQISSAPAYNYAILNSAGIPHAPFITTHTLLPLPANKSYCLWEDPQETYHFSFDTHVSYKKIKYHLFLLLVNIKQIWDLKKEYLLCLALLLSVSGFLMYKRNVPIRVSQIYQKLIFFTSFYVSGYLLITITDRYIWILSFTLLILFFTLLQVIRSYWHALVAKVMMLLMTGYFIYLAAQLVFTSTPHAPWQKNAYENVEAVMRYIPPGSNIAGYQTRDLWSYFALYDLHDYGGIASYPDWKSLEAALKKYPVQFIIFRQPEMFAKLPADIASHLIAYKSLKEFSIYLIR